MTPYLKALFRGLGPEVVVIEKLTKAFFFIVTEHHADFVGHFDILKRSLIFQSTKYAETNSNLLFHMLLDPHHHAKMQLLAGIVVKSS